MLNLKFVLAAIMAAFLVTPAAGQSAEPIDQFRDWAAFKAESDNGMVCYALSQPQSMEPQGVRRGDVFFYVTARPGEDVRGEVSVIIGYPYEDGSRASIEIGSESFSLVTEEDGAWIENVAEEDRLVQAMRGGATMIVRGTSQRGTDTTDRYSLMGLTAALERIAEECT